MTATYILTAAVTFCWHVCGFFLNAGGPGVHDPCERDPTDVLSDLSPQQADTITESAQVSHISCCHLSLLPTQLFFLESEVFLIWAQDLCVSAWSMKTCDLLVLIYIHIKQFLEMFFSLLWYFRLLKWATVGCFYLFFWNVVVSGWSSTGVKALLKGISLSSVSIKSYSVFQKHWQ